MLNSNVDAKLGVNKASVCLPGIWDTWHPQEERLATGIQRRTGCNGEQRYYNIH